MAAEKDWYDIAVEEFVFAPDPIQDEEDHEKYMTDFKILEAILGREICNVDDHLEAIKFGNAQWFKEAERNGLDPSPIFRLL